MKLVMDEKLKNRLVGLAVIISLGAIFAPAIIKKSNQPESFRVNVKLPPKPLAPDVVMSDEKEVFKTIKVAKVKIEQATENKQSSELVKAEPIKSDLVNVHKTQTAQTVQDDAKTKAIQLALNDSAKTAAKQSVNVSTKEMKKQKVIASLNRKAINKPLVVKTAQRVAKKVNSLSLNKKNVYAVQLASFAQLSNAQALVSRLQKKGYKANYVKAPSRQGSFYKVFVGYSPSKNEVIKLKTQLASAMQLNGFVVNTGVS
jgi:DedD protein